MPKIGEFELLVVLAILRQRNAPFANEVRRDLEDNARRSVTRGALYRTLDRLKAKGLVDWSAQPDASATRGGNPSRRLRVTEKGIDAIHESRAILLDFFEGADPALGQP